MSGAATTWLRVNMAAAEAPSGAMASARSGLPLAFIPAVQDEKKKPFGSDSTVGVEISCSTFLELLMATRTLSPGKNASPLPFNYQITNLANYQLLDESYAAAIGRK